jgi:hypothetical protein
MGNVELSKIGNILAAELDKLSALYHVKSDQHEILIWEADILRAKAQDLIEKCGLNENLNDSTLISKWGGGLATSIPEIANRVKEFHEQYNSAKST